MNAPHPDGRIVSLDLDHYSDKERALTAARRPARGAEALLRVSQDGVCLEVEPFHRFEPLPPPSSLLGAHVGQALPAEVGSVISREVRDGGLRRRVREVTCRGHRLSIEVSPTRDGTCWVRLRSMGGRSDRQAGRSDEAPATLPISGGQASFRVDADGRIADWNTAAARVTGLTADAVVGRSLSQLSDVGGGWATRFEQGVAVAAETEPEFEEWLWRQDGRRICLAVVLKSGPGGYRASLRDVHGPTSA